MSEAKSHTTDSTSSNTRTNGQATDAAWNAMNAWMKAPMDAMKAFTEGADPFKATTEATAKMMESVTAPLKDMAVSERTRKAMNREVELAGKMMGWTAATSADQIKAATENGQTLRTLGEEGVQIVKDGVRTASRAAMDPSAQLAAARDQAARINEYGTKVAKTQMDMATSALEHGRNEGAKLMELGMAATKARTEDMVAMQAEMAALPFKMAEANLKATKPAESAPKA